MSSYYLSFYILCWLGSIVRFEIINMRFYEKKSPRQVFFLTMKYIIPEGTSANIFERPQRDFLTLCYCRNYLMLVLWNSATYDHRRSGKIVKWLAKLTKLDENCKKRLIMRRYENLIHSKPLITVIIIIVTIIRVNDIVLETWLYSFDLAFYLFIYLFIFLGFVYCWCCRTGRSWRVLTSGAWRFAEWSFRNSANSGKLVKRGLTTCE